VNKEEVIIKWLKRDLRELEADIKAKEVARDIMLRKLGAGIWDDVKSLRGAK
jgi:hypothetical protein